MCDFIDFSTSLKEKKILALYAFFVNLLLISSYRFQEGINKGLIL